MKSAIFSTGKSFTSSYFHLSMSNISLLLACFVLGASAIKLETTAAASSGNCPRPGEVRMDGYGVSDDYKTDECFNEFSWFGRYDWNLETCCVQKKYFWNWCKAAGFELKNNTVVDDEGNWSESKCCDCSNDPNATDETCQAPADVVAPYNVMC